MTRHPHGSPSWEERYAPPRPPHQGSPDMSLMMGRILERTETTGERVDRLQSRLDDVAEHLSTIDARLIRGDGRMAAIEAAAEATTTQVAELKAVPPSPIPPVETLIKHGLQWALPLVALWAVGAADVAKEMIVQAARAKLGGM